ncbi:mobile mystery protein A [uncultured Treponema sp.]|uniref:mobile mystery protein A n=1 Tax=Treponema sp. TaxID=166 RepID=UPI00298D9E14|nr:mobile mystery protein A [uncultured Treponema sp.]
MNERITRIRALDRKISSLSDAKNIVPAGSSWINMVREAIGMTAIQLAARLGVTQPRVAKMESNEENLKLSTIKKVAEAMGCDFVYYFKPKTTFQDIVQNQAKKRAREILSDVNLNMALENQSIETSEAVQDMADDFINGNTKRIWD